MQNTCKFKIIYLFIYNERNAQLIEIFNLK